MNGLLQLRATWAATVLAGRLSPALAARPAARLWFTPWRVGATPTSRQREAEWLAATEPLTVPFAGRRLHGFTAGAGPAVLLVHGWGDHAARLGAFISPLVDSGHRVIGVDLPAHGASPGRQTNIFEGARAITAAATHVGGVDAIVAHSLGGAETIVALERGLRVRAVALVASAVRLTNAIEPFARMFALPPGAVTGLQREIERRFGQGVWEELAADRAARSLDAPALVVHDRDDPQVPFADGERLAAAWPTATLHVTDGLKHHRVLRDPGVVTAVTDFLTTALGSTTDETSASARLLLDT